MAYDYDAKAKPVWESKDRREITLRARQFFDTQERNRVARTALTELSTNYDENRPYYIFNSFTRTIQVDPETLGGACVPILPAAEKISVAAATQKRFRPACESVRPGTMERRVAQQAGDFLSDIFYHHGGQSFMQWQMKRAGILGDPFIKVDVDETAVETLIMAPDEMRVFIAMSADMGIPKYPLREPRKMSDGRIAAPFRMPRIVWRDQSPNTFLVPNGAKHLEECRMFAVVEYMPLENARRLAQRIPGADPEKIQAVNWGNLRRFGIAMDNLATVYAPTSDYIANSQEGPLFNSLALIAKVAQWWVQAPEGFWFCYWFANETLDEFLGVDGEDGGLHYHPYVRFQCDPRQDFFWGMNDFERVTNLQLRYNKLETLNYRNMMNIPQDTIIKPKGMDIEFKVGIGTSMAEYTPMGNMLPQYQVFQSPKTDLFWRFQDRTKRDIFDAMNINAAMLGDAPNRASADLFGRMEEISTRPLQEKMNRLVVAMEKVCTLSLMLARDTPEFSFTRTVLHGNSPDIQEFNNSNLSEDIRVRFTEIKLDPKDWEARLAAGGDLLKAGVFTSKEELMSWVEGGEQSGLRPVIVAYEEEKALHENDLFANGMVRMQKTEQPPENEEEARAVLNGSAPKNFVFVAFDVSTTPPRPLFSEKDIHKIHIPLHEEEARNPSTPEERRQMLWAHIEEHQRAAAREDREAEQKQIALAAQMAVAESTGQQVTTSIAANAKSGDSGGGNGVQRTGVGFAQRFSPAQGAAVRDGTMG